MPEMLVVMTTAAEDEAAGLADKIIDERLAACVQILPPMTSVYVWNGETQRETETLLLIKTTVENFEELESFIKANHSYETPEILAVAAERVSAEYLAWARSVVRAL